MTLVLFVLLTVIGVIALICYVYLKEKKEESNCQKFRIYLAHITELIQGAETYCFHLHKQ